MAIVSERNIARSTFFLTIVVISVITFGVGAYFIVTKNEMSVRELDRLETLMIGQQKLNLQSDVENLLLRIESLNREIQESLAEEPEPDGDDATDVEIEEVDTDEAAIAAAQEAAAEMLQQRVLDRLGWADDLAGDNYFIYKLHDMAGGENFATMLFNPGRPDLEGQSLSTDFPDAKGHDFRKVFMKDIRDRGEAFVIYWYNRDNPGGMEESEAGRKLAYFKHDPGWNWIVARSVYLDQIDQYIAGRRTEQKKTMGIDLTVLGILFVGSVVLALFLAYSFSISIHALLKKYRESEQLHLLELENLSKTLEQQNQRDRLTGAYNRSHFSAELSTEKARSDRYLTPLSIILFDIDHFRSINDKLGSSAGDTVLKDLVALVKDNIRKTDIFARWGGGEFAILAPGVNLEQGRLFAEKLQILIEGSSFSINKPVTCSFGVSFYQPSEDLEAFVQRADAALQQAKERGRNRCVALAA